MDSGSTVKDFGVLAGSASVCRSRMQGSGVDIGVETCANVHAEGNREGDSTGGAPAERAAKRRRLLGDDGTDYFSEGAESPGTVRTGSFSPQERRAQLVLVEKMSRYARGSVVPHVHLMYIPPRSRGPPPRHAAVRREYPPCVSRHVCLYSFQRAPADHVRLPAAQQDDAGSSCASGSSIGGNGDGSASDATLLDDDAHVPVNGENGYHSRGSPRKQARRVVRPAARARFGASLRRRTLTVFRATKRGLHLAGGAQPSRRFAACVCSSRSMPRARSKERRGNEHGKTGPYCRSSGARAAAA